MIQQIHIKLRKAENPRIMERSLAVFGADIDIGTGHKEGFDAGKATARTAKWSGAAPSNIAFGVAPLCNRKETNSARPSAPQQQAAFPERKRYSHQRHVR